MKAIVYKKYGSPDVLHLQEVEKPTPKPDEVLIKVHAVAINAADWHLLRADPFLVRFETGLFKPKNPILGADVAGRVEAVGSQIMQFKPGDEVFGDLSGCGWGGFAEYVCAREDAVIVKPPQMSFVEAAAVPMAATTALQALRTKGQIQAGQQVLIYGASGGVGTFAVQIAKSFEARVTAVCSTQKIDLVRSLGADQIVDYTQEDVINSNQRYDLILAANGDRSIFDYKRLLTAQGIYVMSGGSMKQIFQAMLLGPWISMTSGKTMRHLLARPNSTDLTFITGLIETGDVAPVIDRSYPLDAVPEAIRYLETGHAKGKVVITLNA